MSNMSRISLAAVDTRALQSTAAVATAAVTSSPSCSSGPLSPRTPLVCNAEHGGTKATWGRRSTSSLGASLGALAVMLLCPGLVWFMLWSCTENDCSIISAAQRFVKLTVTQPPSQTVQLWWFPAVVTWDAVAVWCLWLLVQFLLYTYVPGPTDQGQPTCGGNVLKYRVNGWRCLWITYATSLLLCYTVTGWEGSAVVADNWLQLFWISNAAGFALAGVSYLKACLLPTDSTDNKWTGSMLYDAFMGVEHNPRLTSHPYSFDFKLFFNGRPGIIAWPLINFCFACSQYSRYGYVTNSMIILNILQAIYVLDFFWNEGWYVRTMDITNEHFGFYLAWGDLVWLPFTYTLQGLYLSRHPVELSNTASIGILVLGIGGYLLFRRVNAEKDRFRKHMQSIEQLVKKERAALRSERAEQAARAAAGASDGLQQRTSGRDKAESSTSNGEKEPSPHFGRRIQVNGQTVFELPNWRLWGRPTRYIAASFRTGAKGQLRQSFLLLSGCWGLSRHMNYLGDLMLSTAFCLTCGFNHILPYFYIIYMLILLGHRVQRDDSRCSDKYGSTWKHYTSIVRWRILPYVY